MALQRVQLEKDRTMLVADAQLLHDSTQELCSVRDALAEERSLLSSGLQHVRTLQQQASLEQAAVEQQKAAVADAESKLDQLQVQISEKKADLSKQSLKA
jgi:phage shock protein A